MSKFSRIYQRILPSPFTIAVILTLITFVGALFFKPEAKAWNTYLVELTGFWEEGLWDPGKGGLYFAFQMMLMLILGHVLALSKPVSKLIDGITYFCKNTATSALFITFFTILISFFSWGLALIFGAILARKTGEKFSDQKKKLNYGLIGACGYVGLMTWHGGLSGSAPLKAAEKGNLQEMMGKTAGIPESVPITDTILSQGNITIFVALLIILPLCMYWMGKKSNGAVPQLNTFREVNKKEEQPTGAEKIDHSSIPGILLGSVIVIYLVYKMFQKEGSSVIDPNFINLFLFGLCLIMHQSFQRFLKGVNYAIGDASGILIQFPLYFGIIGIMKSSGMIDTISSWFVMHSTADTFPFVTFFSAGMVNIFVPSGGGQWVVQGPIIINAAQEMGIPFSKVILSLSYGDQLTNMLQPFWALPLLGITGLKAQKILPYTLFLFVMGVIIFGLGIFLI